MYTGIRRVHLTCHELTSMTGPTPHSETRDQQLMQHSGVRSPPVQPLRSPARGAACEERTLEPRARTAARGAASSRDEFARRDDASRVSSSRRHGTAAATSQGSCGLHPSCCSCRSAHRCHPRLSVLMLTVPRGCSAASRPWCQPTSPELRRCSSWASGLPARLLAQHSPVTCGVDWIMGGITLPTTQLRPGSTAHTLRASCPAA